MELTTLEQTQTFLQKLSNSVWIYAAITVMSETDGLSALQNEIELTQLQKITKLPIEVLQHILLLLVEVGLVTKTKNKYCLTTGMTMLLETVGSQTFVAQLQLVFGSAREFITTAKNKTLRSGWHYTDETILNSIGLLSQFVANDYVPQDKNLQSLLKQPDALFLDVGAGTARIAIRLCEIYPQLQVVAIEPADKPFELALQHINTAKFVNRIELRKIFIEAMTDHHIFDVAWFPQIFFDDQILLMGLKNVFNALKPNGMLLTAAIALNEIDQSVRVKQLVNALYGVMRPCETLIAVLEQVGFMNIKIVAELNGYYVITASKE